MTMEIQGVVWGQGAPALYLFLDTPPGGWEPGISSVNRSTLQGM